MNRVLAGALAGFAATAPMTWAMNRMFRRLPERQRYPLPPRLITERLAERGGLAGRLTEPGMAEASLAAHYAYGAATGALGAPLLRGAGGQGGAPVAAGVAYGLGVWAASYLGWIPAAGILRPATEHPRERVALMLAAHVVWGGATGYLTAVLADWGERSPARGPWLLDGPEDEAGSRLRGTTIAHESANPADHRWRGARRDRMAAVETGISAHQTGSYETALNANISGAREGDDDERYSPMGSARSDQRHG
ncbi:hypothetical protein [Azospirillum sp. SYSU D00513]|uniref:hypothetical protein n=1 Tax=Azospirillum sp. SYSU D00513 TaxID=2812561 RepID=UPI001A96CF4F|nr:hypothetical protein [Azospirillum sp. SYSU D00513]